MQLSVAFPSVCGNPSEAQAPVQAPKASDAQPFSKQCFSGFLGIAGSGFFCFRLSRDSDCVCLSLDKVGWEVSFVQEHLKDLPLY